jgi:hypothetical protein
LTLAGDPKLTQRSPRFTREEAGGHRRQYIAAELIAKIGYPFGRTRAHHADNSVAQRLPQHVDSCLAVTWQNDALTVRQRQAIKYCVVWGQDAPQDAILNVRKSA